MKETTSSDMKLTYYLKEKRKQKPLLLMTHVVCGYPSFEENMRELEIMDSFGVDLVELQFPFSEPSADGPLFVRANQVALKNGTTIDQCFEFMQQVSERFKFKTLMMGYYNTVFKIGHQSFIQRLKDNGGLGYILPDLPIEEAAELHTHSKAEGIAPIILMTPTCSDKRLSELGHHAEGFTYVVARKGVTGQRTAMDKQVAEFIRRCKQSTDSLLAVGFGIDSQGHLDFVQDHADIAIIGTAALKVWEFGKEKALCSFFEGLGLRQT